MSKATPRKQPLPRQPHQSRGAREPLKLVTTAVTVPKEVSWGGILNNGCLCTPCWWRPPWPAFSGPPTNHGTPSSDEKHSLSTHRVPRAVLSAAHSSSLWLRLLCAFYRWRSRARGLTALAVGQLGHQPKAQNLSRSPCCLPHPSAPGEASTRGRKGGCRDGDERGPKDRRGVRAARRKGEDRLKPECR